MSKEYKSVSEYEIPSDSYERIQRINLMQTILKMVSNWESYPAEVFCLEEGFETLIDMVTALDSLPPSRLLRQEEVHDDPLDTDFHSENMIQKIITIKSQPNPIKESWLQYTKQLFAIILEALITLRQELYRDSNSVANKSFERQRERLKAFLRDGIDPALPASSQSFTPKSPDEVEEEFQRGTFISLLKNLPMDFIQRSLRKEIKRRKGIRERLG